jgi:hypothetical protein
VEGVGLPEVVGVGFGKGEAPLGCGVGEGFEEFVAVDVAVEGGAGDLFAAEESALDAGAVDGSDVVFFAVEGGEDLLDGFEEVFGFDFAG